MVGMLETLHPYLLHSEFHSLQLEVSEIRIEVQEKP